MIGDALRTTVLSLRIIPNPEDFLLRALNVPEGHRSLGLITTDCDDVSYAALDEATKKAEVSVVYAKSMYAGSGNASTRLAGEFIGILSAPGPAQARSGLAAAVDFIQNDAAFYSADEENTIPYFAHCIAQTGTYLSKMAEVPQGTPMAYLIAPPMEAMVGLDEALKAARGELKGFYGPPTETNFAGGLLTGNQYACKMACEAFARTVERIAAEPLKD